MDNSLRVPLIVLELAALAAILALVDGPVPRVFLGLLIGLLLARSALLASGPSREVGAAPQGVDDRRHDHLFRHWVNVLLKKIREFHTVCQGVADGGVNISVGQLRINEIEKEIRDLIAQVTESAMPGEIQKERRSRRVREPGNKAEAYGE
ncbi:MAG: hypothetical protein V3U13_05980 [Gemmatimonadota bacterium]|jgi:hypothetical protein